MKIPAYKPTGWITKFFNLFDLFFTNNLRHFDKIPKEDMLLNKLSPVGTIKLQLQ